KRFLWFPQIVLLTGLVTVLAATQSYTPDYQASRRECRWINTKFECLYHTCTISIDDKQTCTTRVGPPPADIDQERLARRTRKRHCRWNGDKLICTIERCAFYPNGLRNCSTTTI
ncbi:hypothetical protein KR200_005739, partial [Drosophila serrata]